MSQQMVEALSPIEKPDGLSDENWEVLKTAIRWPAITTVDGGLHLTSWAVLDGIINICVNRRSGQPKS
ncbi:hypothetical protein HOU03_gp277 [Caulobacter phage CcrSC]|uniref:Uncharacterized protein n=1 Tax=Caulobacter phage CcrSC TaxID=2283272 RepID=A0A385EDP6_9CAUD|nr:hypothetical protein HOU03_gp277 [Caulobacter phage CcrSC]AXQ69991.1 hypothetical protein CcrSC_gp409 [Caulobacter phage CcrSC]